MLVRSACFGLGILVITACSAASSSGAAKTTTTTAVALRSVTFSLRPVVATSSPPCVDLQLPSSGKQRRCYKLGAPILGVADVEAAEAMYDRNQRQWTVVVT